MSFWLSTRRSAPTARRNHSPMATWFDRMFEEMMPDWPPLSSVTGSKVPALNLAENQKAYTVALEMPGIDPKDIEVEMIGNQLTVRAERKLDEGQKGQDFHRVEHYYGWFSRSLTLPEGVNADKVEASYDHGILTLTVPKVETTPARKISIKTD